MTTEGSPASSSSDNGGPSASPGGDRLLAGLVGESESACAQAVAARGGIWRVCGRDGQPFAMTMDWCPDRVNVEVTAGIVTRAWVG